MKITEHSIINVVESKKYIDHHSKFNSDMFKILGCAPSDALSEKDKAIISYYGKKYTFFNEQGFRRLILSNNVNKDIFNNYIVPKEIRYNVLRTLPNRKDSIQVDEKLLFRYTKTNDEILVCFDYYKPNDDLLYNYFFRIDLINETFVKDEMGFNKTTISHEEFIESYFSLFMLVVTYLELTNIETIILDGNKKVGTKKTGKYLNTTNKRFIIVRSDWNVEKLDLRDIHVRGHWRLQPCGVGRSQYKYVYIKPYDKGITRKLAQKELVC